MIDRFAFGRFIGRDDKCAQEHQQKSGRLVPGKRIHADQNGRCGGYDRLQVHVDAYHRGAYGSHADGNECVGGNRSEDKKRMSSDTVIDPQKLTHLPESF